MKRLYETLDITYDALSKKDWDSVLIVSGDEGMGKSNLVLAALEYWRLLQGFEVSKEDVKFIELDIVRWTKALSDAKKTDMIILDESGDLSNKRTMGKLSMIITRAYQIIRGDNLFTILVLPSVFDLDPFFTKRRARCLIKVYARGKYAFWERESLRKMVALNQNRYLKTEAVVPPTFRDTFPKYKGILKDAYLQKKKEYMNETRKDLYEEVKKLKGSDGSNGNGSPRDQAIVKFSSKNGTRATAEAFDLSQRQIQTIVKKYADANNETLI